MYKLVLPILAFFFVFLPLPSSQVEAAPTITCSWPQAAGFFDTIVTVGGSSAGIVLTAKPTLGMARFQDTALTFCVGTDDGAGVDVDWFNDLGVRVDDGPVIADNGEDTWTPGTTVVGPLYVSIVFQGGAGTVISNRFMVVAPLPPTDATNCTTGPDNRCLDFDPLPSYALGGQVYNQFFNSSLQTLFDAGTTLPKSSYFPNPAYENYSKDQLTDVLGLRQQVSLIL